jgi:hypothetical protein
VSQQIGLDPKVQEAILAALKRGNSVEVRQNKNGLVVYEVRKGIVYGNGVAKG